MLPEVSNNAEYVEETDDIVPGYSRSSWHTPTRDEVFGSPNPSFSPVYTPDDYTWWSATGCTAGNGERFDPCGRSSIKLSEVSIILLRA